MVRFPEGFRWGVGTYAYQVEGAADQDGRGESIWDRFCATPGTILNGDSGLVACDHYHRYREDVQLMKELGAQTYCFSIAWPRVVPLGKGAVNEKGLDFYERLIDSLLEAGIEPFATLYHWDLPQTLQDDIGGWGNRETAYAFADYVDVVSRRLGDRVHNWLTLNERAVTAFEGHEDGIHAPGFKDARLAWQTSHNFLLAHGLAVPILRANGNSETRVGITLNFTAMHPGSDSQEDRELARFVDGKYHRWFLDPIFRGEYPADVLAKIGDLAPVMEAGDLEIISRPLDFMGFNYYTRSILRHTGTSPEAVESVRVPSAEYTELDWEVYPPGIYEHLTRLHREYSIPDIYITENGAAFADVVDQGGQVQDPRRTNYIREHLKQIHTA